MYIGFHVKRAVLLSDVNETWILSTDFLKVPKYQNLMQIRPVGAELFHAGDRAGGRTDGRTILVRF